MVSKAAVAAVADNAASAHRQGYEHVTIGAVTFNLIERGYCTRFVRQCHEAALAVPPFTWKYIAPNAIEMEKNLASMGQKVTVPDPGDVVCFNRNSGRNGHIGIVAGGGYFYENTSSTVRGPGTVKSRFTPALLDRVTGYYQTLPKEATMETQPWAREAVKWAVENGLTDGTDLSLEMQRSIVMLWRYHKRFGRA